MGQVTRDLVRIGKKSGPVGTYTSIGAYTPNFRKLLFRLLYCRVFTMLRPGSDIEFAASIYQLSLPELELLVRLASLSPNVASLIG
jgi:hypothetical protein